MKVRDCSVINSKSADEDIVSCNASTPGGASDPCCEQNDDKSIHIFSGLFYDSIIIANYTVSNGKMRDI
jgi:hypothetical protein